MLVPATAVTSAVVLAALLTKLFDADASGGAAAIAVDLVRQAAYWEEVAEQDADRSLQLQHLSMALALLQAARTLLPDNELERKVGHSVARVQHELEQRITSLRQGVVAEPVPAD